MSAPAPSKNAPAPSRNAVEISVEGIEIPSWLDRARDFVLAVLDRLGKEAWDLSILFCDDAFIRGLNRQYRDRDEATDVLSFDQGENYRDPDGAERFLAGDIVISLDALARNAQEFGISRDEELRRLLVHGILHLCGMDHEDNDPSRPMLKAQEDLIGELAAQGGHGIL
jgi:probable rRNA maturation factor